MSDSLTGYIEGLLRQGYTAEQIKSSLRQNNYPESAINAAFASISSGREAPSRPVPTSTSSQLTSYLNTYLAQGYQVEQLRPYLIQQGYKAKDVDAAIAAATGQTVRHEHHIAGSTILKVALLILLVASVTFAIFFVKDLSTHVAPSPSEGSRLLDIDLSPSPSTAKAGETITVSLLLTNMGTATKYDVHVEVQLIDTYGTPLVSAEDTWAIATTLERSIKLRVPKDLSPGTYQLKAIADYNSDSPAVASTQYEVLGEEAKTPTAEQNKTSEQKETQEKQKFVIIKTEERENAVDKAIAATNSGNGAEAERICLDITNQAKRDGCLSTIVLSDQDPNHCDKITNSEERDTCYMPFILGGKYEYCEKLVSEKRKGICEDLQHLSKYTPTTGPDINEYTS